MGHVSFVALFVSLLMGACVGPNPDFIDRTDLAVQRGCLVDGECKGDRVCQDGKCVDPIPAQPDLLPPSDLLPQADLIGCHGNGRMCGNGIACCSGLDTGGNTPVCCAGGIGADCWLDSDCCEYWNGTAQSNKGHGPAKYCLHDLSIGGGKYANRCCLMEVHGTDCAPF